MRKYILLILTKEENSEFYQELALNLSPLVDSKHLKFAIRKGVVIFHFASEVSKSEIYDYLTGVLYDDIDGFFLSEFNDNVSLKMSDDILEHLLDLDKDENPDVKMRINYQDKLKENEEEFDEEYVSLMIDEIKKTVPKPSLDYLLEKIKEKGLSSLSPFEKDILDEYSK